MNKSEKEKWLVIKPSFGAWSILACVLTAVFNAWSVGTFADFMIDGRGELMKYVGYLLGTAVTVYTITVAKKNGEYSALITLPSTPSHLSDAYRKSLMQGRSLHVILIIISLSTSVFSLSIRSADMIENEVVSDSSYRDIERAMNSKKKIIAGHEAVLAPLTTVERQQSRTNVMEREAIIDKLTNEVLALDRQLTEKKENNTGSTVGEFKSKSEGFFYVIMMAIALAFDLGLFWLINSQEIKKVKVNGRDISLWHSTSKHAAMTAEVLASIGASLGIQQKIENAQVQSIAHSGSDDGGERGVNTPPQKESSSVVSLVPNMSAFEQRVQT